MIETHYLGAIPVSQAAVRLMSYFVGFLPELRAVSDVLPVNIGEAHSPWRHEDSGLMRSLQPGHRLFGLICHE